MVKSHCEAIDSLNLRLPSLAGLGHQSDAPDLRFLHSHHMAIPDGLSEAMQAGEATYARLPDGSLVIGWTADTEHRQASIEPDGQVIELPSPGPNGRSGT